MPNEPKIRKKREWTDEDKRKQSAIMKASYAKRKEALNEANKKILEFQSKEKPAKLSKYIQISVNREDGMNPLKKYRNINTDKVMAWLDSVFLQGDICDLAGFYDYMLSRDTSLVCALEKRINLHVAADYWVEPWATTESEKQVADFIEAQLSKMGNFKDLISSLLMGIAKGVSIVQLHWALTDDGVYYVKKFSPVPLHRVRIVEKDGCQEYGIVADDEKTIIYPMSDHRMNFIVHSPQAHIADFRLRGLLRPCAFMFFYRMLAWMYWVAGAEKWASPPVIAFLPHNAQDEAYDFTRNALESFTTDAVAVFAAGTQVETVEATTAAGGNSIWKDITTSCNNEYAKVFNGETLTTEVSSTSGNRATAQVHQEILYGMLLADAMRLADTLRNQLFRTMLELNSHLFSKDEVLTIPVIWFDVSSTGIKPIDNTALETGLVMKNQVLKEYGLPRVPKEQGGNDFMKPPSEAKQPSPIPQRQLFTKAEIQTAKALKLI